MSGSHLLSLIPLILVASAVVAALGASAARRGRGPVFAIACTGLGAAIVSIPFAALQEYPSRIIAPLFVVDDYALFLAGLLLFASLALTFVSHDYLKVHGAGNDAYYILLLSATLGAMVMVVSDHFASFFLGLEALTIPLYGLISYPADRKMRMEAGIKYLILSSVASSFLLFGMALLYGRIGFMEFSAVGRIWPHLSSDPALWTGVVMMVVGMGFKLALVPFHMWTPDVYQGAPAPVAAFVATLSKGAVFALMLRLFINVDFSGRTSLFTLFAILATASMFGGNLLALFQKDMKRILAYSSISHLGYLLIPFLATGPVKAGVILFYLAQYFVTVIIAFSVIGLLSPEPDGRATIEDVRGLYSRRPWPAGILALAFLSLAGLPFTAGFMGKFFIVTAAMSSALIYLVIILVVNSVIGLFYYFRVIAALFAVPEVASEGVAARFPPLSAVVIAVLATLMILWGIFPSSLVDMVFGVASHS